MGFIAPLAFYAVISFVFIILLSARVSFVNAGRPSVFFGFFTALSLIVCAALWYSMESIQETGFVLTILVLVLLNELITGKALFMEYNSSQISPGLCREIGNDMIGQMVEADRSGAEHADIYVLKSESDDNWPIALGGLPMIKNTLRHYKILRRDFDITLIPSDEITEKYHLINEK
ncbi:hypothetical protein SAMN06296386_103200 [Lachnospiraceae bacterium]|nr:hypothetical protein SAMN06296386_103200 [Lachnospiraceae bacterium]